MRLYLTSSSPRRREILSGVGYEFTVLKPRNQDVVKKLSKFDPVEVLKVARAKLEGFRDEGVYLSADTVVVLDGLILPKPSSENEAIRFLKMLSGRVHKVYTAYIVRRNPGGAETGKIECTEVKFRKLSKKEIEWLIKFDNPYDKAGGYAIQGRAGIFIEWIKGDFYNVVGLPVSSVYNTLKGFGIFPSGFYQGT